MAINILVTYSCRINSQVADFVLESHGCGRNGDRSEGEVFWDCHAEMGHVVVVDALGSAMGMSIWVGRGSAAWDSVFVQNISKQTCLMRCGFPRNGYHPGLLPTRGTFGQRWLLTMPCVPWHISGLDILALPGRWGRESAGQWPLSCSCEWSLSRWTGQ